MGFPLTIVLGEGTDRMNIKIFVHFMYNLAELPQHTRPDLNYGLEAHSVSDHWRGHAVKEMYFANDAFVSRCQF